MASAGPHDWSNAPLQLMVTWLQSGAKAEASRSAGLPRAGCGAGASSGGVRMSRTASQLPGEALDHDAQLLMLTLKPLADSASADEFSDRVSTAIEKHFPYLERGFDSEEAKGVWVLRQVPLAYGAEARAKYESLSTAEKGSPHAVAAMCIEVIANAKPQHAT